MLKACDVALLAENRLLREAFIRLLSKSRGIRVIAASGYSPGVNEQIVACNPNIILLDSNGLTFSNSMFIAGLRQAIHGLLVVMIDMELDENTFLIAVRAGAVGYVLKDASSAEVLATVCAVRMGQAVCPPALSMFCFRQLAQQGAPPAISWNNDFGLSRRETQLVELLRDSLTNKEIAARLGLSEQTIKNHVHHILRKLSVSSRLDVNELCDRLLSQKYSASSPLAPPLTRCASTM